MILMSNVSAAVQLPSSVAQWVGLCGCMFTCLCVHIYSILIGIHRHGSVVRVVLVHSW